MTKKPVISVVIVAAGSSSRMGGDVPKPYQLWRGKPVLSHSLEAFCRHPAVSNVVVAVNLDHAEWYAPLTHNLRTVAGGKTRQESVFHGLQALADSAPDYVLIHDAARPLVSAALIDRVIAALSNHQAVIPAIAVSDTIKVVENGLVTHTPDRASLRAVQTPQGFHFSPIMAAHAAAQGSDCSDDAMVAERAGIDVQVVEGDSANMKLTIPQDWARLAGTSQWRSASGYDVHRLQENPDRPLVLGGIEIPSPLALVGHSDADVVLHAITDALLGCIAAGDIGMHFPPSDPQWKDADSADFIRHTCALVRAAGGRIAHVDVTVIAETPRLSPHRDDMRSRIADLLDIAPNQISVKATTTEGLGFTGRKEGIAAQATATVELVA